MNSDSAAMPPPVPDDDPRTRAEWELRLRSMSLADLIDTVENAGAPDFLRDLVLDELHRRVRQIERLGESLAYSYLK